MTTEAEIATRRRAHAERMLARARKRLQQVEKVVAKWEKKLAEMSRAAVAESQPKLWPEEPAGQLKRAEDELRMNAEGRCL